MWGMSSNNNNQGGNEGLAKETEPKSDYEEGGHSVFGDGYSIKSRSNSVATNRFQDEAEADYDHGATALYRCIENKQWDAALQRLDLAPEEARTWVSRREAKTQKTRWRLLPLHAVCIFRAPLALIEALIEVYEEGPQMKDDQGMLPVHLACRNGASKGVVLTLLGAFPESLFIRDRKRRTLHDLIEASSSTTKDSVLAALKQFEIELAQGKAGDAVSRHPTPGRTRDSSNSVATHEVDYENRTLLFRYLLKKDWKAASKRALSHPEEAATWIVTKGFNGNLRFLPLHKACVLKPPVSILKSLLDAYPEAVEDQDQDGWLPIHCACFYGSSEEAISTLLKANPKSAHAKDDESRMPIHYACLKGATQAVVDLLLATYKKGAGHKDEEGRLPIHHACSKGAPESIIDALLRAFPKGAQGKDNQGRLALHHACRKNASERAIRTLLRVYPRATQIKDDQDKLPLHYACQHGAGPSVVAHLLTTYPESINVKNGFGHTPFDEAKTTHEAGKHNMDGVIKVMHKVQKEQNKLHKNDLPDTRSKDRIIALESKLTKMERKLGKVSALGKEMKSAIRKNKDPADILDHFADELMSLSKSERSKTPKKHTPLTPVSGLFGRSKSRNHRDH